MNVHLLCARLRSGFYCVFAFDNRNAADALLAKYGTQFYCVQTFDVLCSQKMNKLKRVYLLCARADDDGNYHVVKVFASKDDALDALQQLGRKKYLVDELDVYSD